MTLSESLLDAIDGAEETKGRDSQLGTWAVWAERMENALRVAQETCYNTQTLALIERALQEPKP
nr:hypothetical protein [uncultured Rhodopila sp.]